VSTEGTVEETLAWEAEKRPRIAAIAVAGGIFTLAGNVLLTATTSGGPTQDDGFISLTEAVGARVEGRAPEGPSLSVRAADFLGDKVALLSVSTILTSLSALCLALLIIYLWRAATARTDAVGRLPYYAAVAALVLIPLGHTLWQIGRWIGSANFADASERTAGAARDITASAPIGIGFLLDSLGTFALAVAVVIVCLNAMRVGLLTRFFGVLGIIIGVLPIFSMVGGYQLDQPGIIRAFWMVAVGLLIAGRIKQPPAWQTGRAEPWPTQQQLREQRDAARGKPSANGPAPAGEKPAELRKKRKRRR
jgi:hypothetical protein